MVFYKRFLFLGYLVCAPDFDTAKHHKQVLIHGAVMLLSFLALRSRCRKCRAADRKQSDFLAAADLVRCDRPAFFLGLDHRSVDTEMVANVGHHTAIDPYYLYAAAIPAADRLAQLSVLVEPKFGLISKEPTGASVMCFCAY